ncbi:MAG TPA: hypothetical protein VNK03_00745 [Gammaproteobacteria bacterium]|nr:hypothetical protein [Gammaproteobacteria bacterium]
MLIKKNFNDLQGSWKFQRKLGGKTENIFYGKAVEIAVSEKIENNALFYKEAGIFISQVGFRRSWCLIQQRK